MKVELIEKYGLAPKEVKEIMLHQRSLSYFTDLVEDGKDPKLVYTWIYQHLAKIAKADDLSLDLAL